MLDAGSQSPDWEPSKRSSSFAKLIAGVLRLHQDRLPQRNSQAGPWGLANKQFNSENLRVGAFMKLQVVIHPAEEGGFWAEIPAFAGCVSEGETLAETLLNIKEAAEGWLEVSAMRIKVNSQIQIAEIEL